MLYSTEASKHSMSARVTVCNSSYEYTCRCAVPIYRVHKIYDNDIIGLKFKITKTNNKEFSLNEDQGVW